MLSGVLALLAVGIQEPAPENYSVWMQRNKKSMNHYAGSCKSQRLSTSYATQMTALPGKCSDWFLYVLCVLKCTYNILKLFFYLYSESKMWDWFSHELWSMRDVKIDHTQAGKCLIKLNKEGPCKSPCCCSKRCCDHHTNALKTKLKVSLRHCDAVVLWCPCQQRQHSSCLEQARCAVLTSLSQQSSK